MKILKRREHVEVIQYQIFYEWIGEAGSGFGFPCDANGTVDTTTLAPAGLENLISCRNGTHEVGPGIIERRSHSYNEAAVGECDQCGCEVFLSMSLVNECDKCGAEYNSSGQRLASREQWGDDTGESVSEIMRGNLPMNGDY